MEYNGKKIDEKTTLNFLVDHNIINLDSVSSEMDKMEEKKYLAMHNHPIWQDKNGYWYTRFDMEGSTKPKLVKRKTKEALNKFIEHHYRQKVGNPYVDEVFEQWNSERLQYNEISEQTAYKYKNTARRFLTKDCSLMRKRISGIDEIDLREYIKDMIRQNELSYKAYSDLRTILIGTFSYGYEHGYTSLLIGTFFANLKLPKRMFKRKSKDDRNEAFNEVETQRLLDFLSSSDNIVDLGIALDLLCGARRGELCALKPEDVFWNQRFIHIQRTEVTYKDAETGERVCTVQDFPKTEAGDRLVFIPPSAIALLDKIIDMNPDGEYLFEKEGKRIRSSCFNRRLQVVCDKLGIPRRSMHKLRKTYITKLLDDGVNEKIVADQSGHKDPNFTKSVYYVSVADEAKRRQQIDMAFGEYEKPDELTAWRLKKAT